jgi:hypothetical protein
MRLGMRVWIVHENQDGYGFKGGFDTEEAARKIDPHLHTTTTYDITTSVRSVDESHDVVQVVMLDVLFEQFKRWLAGRSLQTFPIPHDPDDLPTYGVGPTQSAWDRMRPHG